MSIYCTLWDIKVPVLVPEKPCARNPRDGVVKEPCREEWFEVFAQRVPGHIKDDVDWLPPPVDDDDGTRAVVFVEAHVGTYAGSKEGQRYTDPLKTITGEEYYGMSMCEVVEMLEELLEEKHWPRRKRR